MFGAAAARRKSNGLREGGEADGDVSKAIALLPARAVDGEDDADSDDTERAAPVCSNESAAGEANAALPASTDSAVAAANTAVATIGASPETCGGYRCSTGLDAAELAAAVAGAVAEKAGADDSRAGGATAAAAAASLTVECAGGESAVTPASVKTLTKEVATGSEPTETTVSQRPSRPGA